MSEDVRIGADYIAEVMDGFGVTHVFYVPQFLTNSIARMDSLGITVVMAHGEKAAAYMADGYARISGRVGICMAQRVGGANLAAGLKDAAMANVPIVALSGGSNPTNVGRRVYQEIDDFRMFDPVTKLNSRLETVELLSDVLPRGFQVATSGRPGPVHVEIAGHFGERIEKAPISPNEKVNAQFGQVPAFRIPPDDSSLKAVAALFEQAERPLIVAGGGIRSSGAGAALVALAEHLSIPVATSLTAKGMIPDTHGLSIGVVGLYSRASANRIAAEADFAFFVGCDAGSQVSNQWKLLRPTAKVAQLNIDPEALGSHYPLEGSLLCDARLGLQLLVEQTRPSDRGAWLRRVEDIREEWQRQLSAVMASDETPMRPDRICAEISEALPQDAVVVCDTGHSAMWATQTLDLRFPSQDFIRCEGSLGWCLPAAIGVKSAVPDRPVFGFTGDGGFYYHIGELETAVRYGLKIVMVVNDNGCMNQELPDIEEAYPLGQTERAKKLWNFSPTVDLAEVARSFGWGGVTVTTPKDLAAALKESLTHDGPVVIVAKSDPTILAPRAWNAT